MVRREHGVEPNPPLEVGPDTVEARPDEDAARREEERAALEKEQRDQRGTPQERVEKGLRLTPEELVEENNRRAGEGLAPLNAYPIQPTYPTGMQPGLEGMPASMTTYDGDSMIVETAAGIGFGLAVSQGTKDRTVVLGGAAFKGVSYRDITLVHDVANLDKYKQYENIGIMVRGDIWVKAAVAVTPADPPAYDVTTGAINKAGTAIVGAKFMGSAGAGALVILRLK